MPAFAAADARVGELPITFPPVSQPATLNILQSIPDMLASAMNPDGSIYVLPS